MNVPFDEFDKAALKCHGYRFSDEDCTTDTDDETNCGDLELYKRYKPPPLIIPPENIVVIKAVEPSQTQQNGRYLWKNEQAFEKKRSLPEKQGKKVDDNVVITSNFFKVLEQSDSSSEEENENNGKIDPNAHVPVLKLTNEEIETQNGHSTRISPDEISKRNIKTDRKRNVKDKKQLREPLISEQHRRSISTFIRDSSSSNDHSLTKKVVTKSEINSSKKKSYRGVDYNLQNEDIEIFAFYQPCLLWSVFFEKGENLVVPFNSELRTSWDYISTNNIYHSHKLIEQEYDNIIGSKKTPTEPLAKLSLVTSVQKFFSEIECAEFLIVVGVVIASYVCIRINK